MSDDLAAIMARHQPAENEGICVGCWLEAWPCGRYRLAKRALESEQAYAVLERSHLNLSAALADAHDTIARMVRDSEKGAGDAKRGAEPADDEGTGGRGSNPSVPIGRWRDYGMGIG